MARAFVEKGYKVALAVSGIFRHSCIQNFVLTKIQSRTSRSPDTDDQIHFTADVSKPETVADLFSRVKAKLGTPSVVVYNGKCESNWPTPSY